MRKILAIIALAVFASVSAQADLWTVIGDFFGNNPSNKWDVTGYACYNTAGEEVDGVKPFGLGGGARVGYWLNPSVGAALDASYCERNWTFASLALTGRGTIRLGTFADVSPYVMAGPGWNINGPAQSVVAVAGGGAVLDIKPVKWFKFMGEYRHITTTEPQDQIVCGLVKSF